DSIRRMEPRARRIPIQFESLAGPCAEEVDVLAAVRHRPPAQDPHAEDLRVECQGSAQVPDANARVIEAVLRVRPHPGRSYLVATVMWRPGPSSRFGIGFRPRRFRGPQSAVAWHPSPRAGARGLRGASGAPRRRASGSRFRRRHGGPTVAWVLRPAGRARSAPVSGGHLPAEARESWDLSKAPGGGMKPVETGLKVEETGRRLLQPKF